MCNNIDNDNNGNGETGNEVEDDGDIAKDGNNVGEGDSALGDNDDDDDNVATGCNNQDDVE